MREAGPGRALSRRRPGPGALAQRTSAPADALRDARECLSLRIARLGATHWETAQAQALAASLEPASSARADTIDMALARMRAVLGADSPRVIETQGWK